ncbi:MAG: TonB-dependent receptor domain-containing protein [Bacteroidia bacterium]
MKKLLTQGWWLCMLLATTIQPIWAQQALRFADAYSREPIFGLAYRYGNQQGSSDSSGVIYLQFNDSIRLQLRHLSYGSWELNPSEVKAALTIGLYFQRPLQHALEPVTVIALRPNEKIETARSLSALEQLHHDAGAVLQQDVSIAGVRKSGNFGFDPVLRGFKHEQLQLVVDGMQSATAACPNRMDPPSSQIMLNRVQSVEILKGPHALRYGNALGGTINFVYQDPNYSETKNSYGQYSSLFETNGRLHRHEARLGRSNKKSDLGLLASFSQGADYRDGNGLLVPAHFMRGSVGAYADFKAGKHNEIRSTFNRNFARNVAFPTLGMDLRTDDTWMFNTRHTRTFSGRALQSWRNNAFISKVDHLMDNLLRDPTNRMVNASTPARTWQWGGRSEGHWAWKKKQLYAGIDFRHESADATRERFFLDGHLAGTSLFEPAWQNALIEKTGLFASWQAYHAGFSWHAAARLEHNRALIRNPSPAFMGSNHTDPIGQWNPGLSAGIRKQMEGGWESALWLARVQRSGSMTERFINFFQVGLDPHEMLGNTSLLPEVNHQLDWQLNLKRKQYQLQFSAFAAYLTNYITAELTQLRPRDAQLGLGSCGSAVAPGVRQFVNIDHALLHGFEFSLAHQWHPRWQHEMAMAYTRGKNISWGEALPEIPPLDMRYKLVHSSFNKRMQTQFRLRQVLAQERISLQFGEQASRAFTLIDLDFAWQWNKQLQSRMGISNLLNMAYYEHLNRPIGIDRIPLHAPGRSIFVMLLLRFP